MGTMGTKTMRMMLAGLALAVACNQSHPMEPDPDPDPDPPDITIPEIGDVGRATIGAAGGTVEVGDLRLDIPAGALTSDTEITVVAEARSGAPDTFTAYSPIYRFEPEGLTFAAPVQVVLPFAGNHEVATVFWTQAGEEAFAALETSAEGGLARAEIQHFSKAFVGTACNDDSCCRRARGSADVLLVVDNSNSMMEEQAALAAQIPRLVEALATGDVDGDGVQDFPAVSSLQIGTVNTDMGTGGFAVPTCDDSDFGDDGLLLTGGSTSIPGCMASYPNVLHFDAESGADAADFAHDASCVALMGINGCGFEQQLESMLKALTPSASSTVFHRGTVGHGDGANAGLVRDDAVLAVLQVTDENDCSALDPELFDPSSPRYPSDLNLRCFAHPEAVHSADRYVEGLLSLKEAPGDLVLGVIAGTPTGTDGMPFADILEHPDMTEAVDPAMETRLRPSCDRPGTGLAFPPRRLIETAAGLEERGGHAVSASICSDDFGPAVSLILERVSRSVAGSCGG